MRLLLDTHILVWALGDRRRLSSQTLAELADPANTVFFSAASIWEIAIKRALNRPDFKLSPELIASSAVETGFGALPIRNEHAAATLQLPFLRGDLFDRMLVAQAQVESLRLLTRDEALREYGNVVRVV